MKGLGELLLVVAAVLIFVVYADAMSNVLDMPDVHVSNSSQQCVNVINYAPEDDYSCENLPEIYNQVWVK